eukprot:gnl/MRDRNA2_/MRDRNA2_90530_c0_seq1.p1 gnl/MRDRNA2_/MRDRNA2_90530_c0~~gnl/MRDRNA2_/MRDRNA2_90530_c0_seq1.p1  ORF type:complete len:228 (+),score=36.69 gnl/MRDRNA2_/MRDRNA2_90530_c0_seq1:106-789(+)
MRTLISILFAVGPSLCDTLNMAHVYGGKFLRHGSAHLAQQQRAQQQLHQQQQKKRQQSKGSENAPVMHHMQHMSQYSGELEPSLSEPYHPIPPDPGSILYATDKYEQGGAIQADADLVWRRKTMLKDEPFAKKGEPLLEALDLTRKASYEIAKSQPPLDLNAYISRFEEDLHPAKMVLTGPAKVEEFLFNVTDGGDKLLKAASHVIPELPGAEAAAETASDLILGTR